MDGELTISDYETGQLDLNDDDFCDYEDMSSPLCE